jgi:signal transduction histidine kinase
MDSLRNEFRNIGKKNVFQLARQMKDYAEVGTDLFRQRMAIFCAAGLLTGYYYSLPLALITAAMMIVAEAYDAMVFRSVQAWNGRDPCLLQRLMIKLVISTITSASVVVFFAVSIALHQGPGPHFMSLFFLFAAAIFAAMNNHQLIAILALRMSIYGAAFIFIPAWDIFVMNAPIQSELWAQLLTSLFVLFFVIDSSRVHLTLYRRNLRQMEDLKLEHKKVENALRIKSEFLSTMSHELRTPLTSIKGSIDIMKSGHFGTLPPKINNMLAISQRNCALLLTLIDETLDLQKIESGHMTYMMEELDAAELARQALAANNSYAERLGVVLELSNDDPGYIVTGDRARLHQVLNNMLSNAAKFSPAGSVVRVKIERIAKRIRLSVIDEGVGLQESDAEKVFDRFSQLDSSDTRNIGGTGLGMNISRKIMEAHNGAIGYVSNADKGTTFYIDMNRAGFAGGFSPQMTFGGSASRSCRASR